MVTPLAVYLPQDRRAALARGYVLPNSMHGSALFADISGFTALAERLTQQFGARRGVEALSQLVNAVYESLVGVVEQYGGSVVSFAGDSITCWFDATGGQAAERATATALMLQAAMHAIPDLSLKVAVTSGTARRYIVGDPQIQQLDTLAGASNSQFDFPKGAGRVKVSGILPE